MNWNNWTFPDIFQLAIYPGSKIMTPDQKTWISWFNVVLLAEAVFTLWAWGQAMAYGIHEWYYPVIAATVAVVIIALDRGIIVQDLLYARKAWFLMGARLAAIVLFSLVTSAPVQIKFLEREVDQLFDEKDIALVDTIRAKATTEETTRFNEKITAEQALLDKEVALGRDKGDKDIAAYREQREAQRSALTTQFTTDKGAIEERMRLGDAKIMDETKGRFTGIRGIGHMVRALQEEKDKATTELNEVRSNEVATFTAFDQETVLGVQGLEKARDQAMTEARDRHELVITTLNTEEKTALDWIRGAQGADLSAKYGGVYKVSRGFMDRYRALSELEDRDPANARVRWMAMVLVMALELGVFLLKLLASELKPYYCRGMQTAALGEDDKDSPLYLSAVAQGYTTMETRRFLGFAPDTVNRLDNIRNAREAVCEAIDTFMGQARTLAQPNDIGLCLTLSVLYGRLENTWRNTVGQALRELIKYEGKLRIPLSLFPWTSDLRYRDPRSHQGGEADVWRISESRLRSWGWMDPTEKIRRAEQAIVTYDDTQRRIVDLVQQMAGNLFSAIQVDPKISKDQLQYERHQHFLSNIRPLLNQLADLERDILAGGKNVPARYSELQDREALERCWIVSSNTMEEMGWIGPQPPEPDPIVVAPATPAPAPTDGRKCPHCQTSMEADWEYCMNCGKNEAGETRPEPEPEPVPPTPVPATPAPVPPVVMITCKGCKTEHVLGTRVCTCGKLLPLKAPEPAPAPAPEPPAAADGTRVDIPAMPDPGDDNDGLNMDVKCPHCGEMTPFGGTECTHCHQSVEATQTP